MSAGHGPTSFPKNLRLLRRKEFRRVYEEGQRRNAPLCTLFFRSNGLTRTRLGITVPVSVGNAVVRNRVKRRVREVFRLHRASLPGGWDIVVNPRKHVATTPLPNLVRELMRLFPATPPASEPGGASKP
jgi:ribonuclease P protein component